MVSPKVERLLLWWNRPYMITIRNLIWIFIGQGWVIFLFYLWGGVALATTIVGIPFALMVWKLSLFVLWPSGLEFRRTDRGPTGALFYILITVWILLAGIVLILFHISLGVAAAATIIGIPAAIQHFKFLLNAVNPFVEAYPNEWARRSAHEVGRTPFPA
ncbi:hypothetical protein P9112_010757 [Eukaryota sp. TZLM1-RC]